MNNQKFVDGKSFNFCISTDLYRSRNQIRIQELLLSMDKEIIDISDKINRANQDLLDFRNTKGAYTDRESIFSENYLPTILQNDPKYKKKLAKSNERRVKQRKGCRICSLI